MAKPTAKRRWRPSSAFAAVMPERDSCRPANAPTMSDATTIGATCICTHRAKVGNACTMPLFASRRQDYRSAKALSLLPATAENGFELSVYFES